MEKVIDKIKSIRSTKGYSHEYMAYSLDLSPSAYTKIERMDTKLTVERLYKIADILETNIGEFIDQPNKTYNQTISENGFGYQDIEHLHTENKETVQKLLETKDTLILQQKEEIRFLKELMKK
jgi:transcriptional regulator with XRE-family HTH domain